MSRLSEIVNDKVPISNINSWVDLGSGNGNVVQELKWNNEAKIKISIDKYPQKFSTEWIFVDDFDIILNKNYDLFTAIDMIEHLPKEDGINLINKIDKYFNNKMFFTPKGFLRQDETTHPELIAANPWQKHISGWDVTDFNNLGYETILLKDFHYPRGLNKYFDAIIAYKMNKQ